MSIWFVMSKNAVKQHTAHQASEKLKVIYSKSSRSSPVYDPSFLHVWCKSVLSFLHKPADKSDSLWKHSLHSATCTNTVTYIEICCRWASCCRTKINETSWRSQPQLWATLTLGVSPSVGCVSNNDRLITWKVLRLLGMRRSADFTLIWDGLLSQRGSGKDQPANLFSWKLLPGPGSTLICNQLQLCVRKIRSSQFEITGGSHFERTAIS